MPEEIKKDTIKEPVTTEVKKNNVKPAPFKGNTKSVYGERKKFAGKGKRRTEREPDDMEQRILDIARVTRVMKGGKRMSFRICIAVGDKKGKVGIALGKAADITMAINKAVTRAKKEMIDVSGFLETIPHQIYIEKRASKILFKPAKIGRGVIAGGVVRVILELAGIKNISAKILGGSNKVNNAKATIEALTKIKRVEKVAKPKVEDKKEEEKKAPILEVKNK